MLGRSLSSSISRNGSIEFRSPICESADATAAILVTGTKDIVLASSGAAMPLLHVQLGPCAEAGHGAPIPGGVRMFCTPAGDALDAAVRNREFKPTATASILHVDMAGVD